MRKFHKVDVWLLKAVVARKIVLRPLMERWGKQDEDILYLQFERPYKDTEIYYTKELSELPSSGKFFEISVSYIFTRALETASYQER